MLDARCLALDKHDDLESKENLTLPTVALELANTWDAEALAEISKRTFHTDVAYGAPAEGALRAMTHLHGRQPSCDRHRSSKC